MKKYKIIISNKEDWIIKTEGKIDLNLYDITYSDLLGQKEYNKFDLIIPLFERDIVHLNKYCRSKHGYAFLLPTDQVVQICEDKKTYYDFMHANGFGDYTPFVSDSLGIPFILKKRKDEWGQNSFVIQNDADVVLHKEQMDSPDFIRQEYFYGKEEYTTHFIFNNEDLAYSYTLKFEFQKDCYVKGIQSPPFKTAKITSAPTEFISIITDILKALDYQGVGCLNYKIKDGVPKIFEINPRVGGSLPLDVNNFLASYLKQLKPELSFIGRCKLFLKSIY